MGHPSLDDLALFAEIARAGGVRAAARVLGASRSHLSRRLAALEERIGVTLVERDELAFALTEAGSALLLHVEAILAEVRAAEDAARTCGGRVRGQLRIAASPLLAEVALERLAFDFLARFPEVSIDLHVAPERVDLRARQVDIAFRTGPLVDDAGLVCRALATSATAMFASSRYLAARGVPASLDALAGHDGILVGSAREWHLREGHVRPRERLRVNSHAAARRAAVAGLGIARFAAVYATGELDTGQLCVVMPEQATSATVFAVMPATGHRSPKVRAFLELAIGRITTEQLCPEKLRGALEPG
jgi:DNA-binding transcriptional LysR family regulator